MIPIAGGGERQRHAGAAGRLPVPKPERIEQVHRFITPICDYWFRSEVRHLDRVPDSATLLVGNHDGGNLPVDAVCLGHAWYRHFGFARSLRVMMHALPFQMGRGLRDLLHDCGCVSAVPENFEAMAEAGESGLIYPGAARESFRTYFNRKVIDLGGRKGFIVRALKNRMTITPVVSVGGHETMFILWRGEKLARLLRADKYFQADAWPIIAGLPFGIWLGPFLPHLPLPSKITIEVLPPIRLAEEIGALLGRRIDPDDAEDAAVIQAGYELVRRTMQAGLTRLYAERRFPVLG
ncbi:MAG: glycerol acyltransferase [Myxococcales bacterium]|nr:glycerol acyltransferase [Myxococcales bacterium]